MIMVRNFISIPLSFLIAFISPLEYLAAHSNDHHHGSAPIANPVRSGLDDKLKLDVESFVSDLEDNGKLDQASHQIFDPMWLSRQWVEFFGPDNRPLQRIEFGQISKRLPAVSFTSIKLGINSQRNTLIIEARGGG